MARQAVLLVSYLLAAILSCGLCSHGREASDQFSQTLAHHSLIRRHGAEKHSITVNNNMCVHDFRSPQNCDIGSVDNPCRMVLLWSTENSTVVFTIVADLSSALQSRGGWAAVGLSHDSLMAESDSLECLFPSHGNVSVLDGWNNDIPDNTVDENQADIKLIYGSLHNEMGNCSFSRTIRPNDTDHSYSLDQPLFILLAIGPLKEGVVEEGTTPLSKHVWHTVSSQSINIVSCNMEPLSEGMWRALLIRFHGGIMISVFLILLPFGALVARYFREVLGTKWIKLHMGLMISGVLSMIIALGFALGHTSFQFHVGLHQVLGIMVIPVAVLHVVIGLFRPQPGKTTKRVVFNWLHRCTGIVVTLMGFLLCFLGIIELETDNDSGKPWMYTCLSVCLVVLVMVVTVMEYIRWRCADEVKYQAVSWKPEDDSSEEDSGVDIGQDMVFSRKMLETLKRWRIALLFLAMFQSTVLSIVLTGLLFTGL